MWKKGPKFKLVLTWYVMKVHYVRNIVSMLFFLILVRLNWCGSFILRNDCLARAAAQTCAWSAHYLVETTFRYQVGEWMIPLAGWSWSKKWRALYSTLGRVKAAWCTRDVKWVGLGWGHSGLESKETAVTASKVWERGTPYWWWIVFYV